MSQLDPTIGPLDISLDAPRTTRRRFHVPGWLALLLSNTKSRLGLAMVGLVVIVAIIAPWISAADPNAFNLFATRQAPSWHHLFGTTDQGSDIFSQVVIGARQSLLLGFFAAALATSVAAALGITAALVGGLVDDIVNVLINIFLVIPPIPLLVVMSGYVQDRGQTTMIVGCWASQAATLAAERSGSRSTTRCVARSTRMVPYRWPRRQAHSSTPTARRAGMCGVGAARTSRSRVDALVGSRRRAASRAPTCPPRARPMARRALTSRMVLRA